MIKYAGVLNNGRLAECEKSSTVLNVLASWPICPASPTSPTWQIERSHLDGEGDVEAKQVKLIPLGGGGGATSTDKLNPASTRPLKARRPSVK
jgi:hypothetical protein